MLHFFLAEVQNRDRSGELVAEIRWGYDRKAGAVPLTYFDLPLIFFLQMNMNVIVRCKRRT